MKNNPGEGAAGDNPELMPAVAKSEETEVVQDAQAAASPGDAAGYGKGDNGGVGVGG